MQSVNLVTRKSQKKLRKKAVDCEKIKLVDTHNSLKDALCKDVGILNFQMI